PEPAARTAERAGINPLSIAGELARFLASTNVTDLPLLALECARMVIASTIASAAMGMDIVSSRIIRELAKERGGAEQATLWFDGAVAAGTLLKLTREQMTQAIALAATSIGGLMVAANTSVAREYHAGLSAMLGIHAALAAHKGLMAEENVLEMPRGFFSAYGGDHLEDVTKDLGQAWDITTDMATKLVPGGHPHHAAAEAVANAAIAGHVDRADVA